MTNEGQEGFFQNVEIPKREIDLKLDELEKRIKDLKILFEQYFLDLIHRPPLDEQKNLARFIREIQRMPFRQAAHRFRLRNLQSRFNTYGTYWEKCLREREEGSYGRDVFKAQLRKKLALKASHVPSKSEKQEKEMKELFRCYKEALQKAGSKNTDINFESFRQVVQKKAESMKREHGEKKLSYQIAIKGGKVLLKTSVRD